MKKVMVFVDGENFRKTISGLYNDFRREEYLPKKAEWSAFFDFIVRESTGNEDHRRVRTYWYVIEAVAPYPYSIPHPEKTTKSKAEWLKKNKKYISKIAEDGFANEVDQLNEMIKRRNIIQRRFDGFRTIQNGIANKHEAIEFRRSGEISYNIAENKLGNEKTVDVNLAVDMLRFSPNYDLAILVSGDQDYVPAVQAVKNMGKQVVNVAFQKTNGLLLPGGAKKLNELTDWSYNVDWNTFRDYLNLDKESHDKK